jgi:hypothetical protein
VVSPVGTVSTLTLQERSSRSVVETGDDSDGLNWMYYLSQLNMHNNFPIS